MNIKRPRWIWGLTFLIFPIFGLFCELVLIGEKAFSCLLYGIGGIPIAMYLENTGILFYIINFIFYFIIGFGLGLLFEWLYSKYPHFKFFFDYVYITFILIVIIYTLTIIFI